MFFKMCCFTDVQSYIIIKLELCSIAFLCNASPPKALIVEYGSDGHSIMFMPVYDVVNNFFLKVGQLFIYLMSTSALCYLFYL